MSRSSFRPVPVVYAVLAVAGAVVPWTFNVRAIMSARDFIGDWTGSGPAVASLTADVLITAIAAAVFILVEGHRTGTRYAWVFVLTIPLVSLACALPLFLWARSRRTENRWHAPKPAAR